MKDVIQRYRYSISKLFHTHEAFVVLIAVLLLMTAVFLRIHSLSSLPPNQAYYDKQVSTIKPVRFNQDAITKIEQLRDSNVANPGTSISTDRDNPFAE